MLLRKDRITICLNKQKLIDFLNEKNFVQLTKKDLVSCGFEVKEFKDGNLIFRNKDSAPLRAKRSTIMLNGTGNILVLEGGGIDQSSFNFRGNNSVCFVSFTKYEVRLFVDLYTDCSTYFGKNMYVNVRPMTVLAAEGQSVFVGDDCIISHAVMIRTADPHLIYSSTSLKRINLANSVIVGDHVWIGQGVLILKGTFIGSGSVLGANAVISGKSVKSNSIWAGNPAKCIKENVFWCRDCTNSWDIKQVQNAMVQTEATKNKFTFFKDSTKNRAQFDFVELIKSNDRNRFAIDG